MNRHYHGGVPSTVGHAGMRMGRMGIMNDDFLLLCERAERSSAAVLENLAHIEATLRDVQDKLATAPFFVRAFASSEVSRGTGQDIAAWTQAVAGLMAAIRGAQAVGMRGRAAGALREAERPVRRQVRDRVAAQRPRPEGP